MPRKNRASAVPTLSKNPHTVLGASAPDDTGELEAADRTLNASKPEPVEMPPSLIEELGRLLGQALAADIRQFPNLAKLRASPA